MKKKSDIIVFLFCIFSLCLSSCDESENIVPKSEVLTTSRVILVEDFTGVQCPNCPKASREIDNLISKYSDNVVSIVYHTNFLGAPITNPKHKSKYDFRTFEAQSIEDLMGAYDGKPAVVLNRKKPSESLENLLNLSSLTLSKAEDELRTIPKVDISIENEFDSNTRKLQSKVTLTPRENYSGDIRLNVCLTESNIVDVQVDNKEYIIDYVHKHVFRKSLTEITGEVVASGLNLGTPIVKTFEYTLPAEDGWWIAKNCSIIAFVSDYSRKTEGVGYVLQGAEKKVSE